VVNRTRDHSKVHLHPSDAVLLVAGAKRAANGLRRIAGEELKN
jgi:hypothetical protein